MTSSRRSKKVSWKTSLWKTFSRVELLRFGLTRAKAGVFKSSSKVEKSGLDRDERAGMSPCLLEINKVFIYLSIIS